MSAKILLVEDDFNFGNVLKGFLEMNSYRVELARDGEWGLESYAQGGFDLVILDVMMPKMDGFSVLKEIRSVDRQTPVFLLTARSLKEDVLHGFKIGADDYLIKPFDTEVLLLKIEAILKRSFGEVRQQDQQVFSIGKFTFDYKHRSLTADGQAQSLTPKEAELLRLLCLHRNDLLPRTKALKLIWGDDNYFNGRSMDVFVTRLRKYLKNDSTVEISSLHGKGMQLTIAS
ncbi:MAG: response regulator transcription factor [Bacteroidota bacterium]